MRYFLCCDRDLHPRAYLQQQIAIAANLTHSAWSGCGLPHFIASVLGINTCDLMMGIYAYALHMWFVHVVLYINKYIYAAHYAHYMCYVLWSREWNYWACLQMMCAFENAFVCRLCDRKWMTIQHIIQCVLLSADCELYI